jgi:hypothetical protein
MARRISGVGWVTVSLRKSTGFILLRVQRFAGEFFPTLRRSQFAFAPTFAFAAC